MDVNLDALSKVNHEDVEDCRGGRKQNAEHIIKKQAECRVKARKNADWEGGGVGGRGLRADRRGRQGERGGEGVLTCDPLPRRLRRDQNAI
jgi:hypothetical protein